MEILVEVVLVGQKLIMDKLKSKQIRRGHHRIQSAVGQNQILILPFSILITKMKQILQIQMQTDRKPKCKK